MRKDTSRLASALTTTSTLALLLTGPALAQTPAGEADEAAPYRQETVVVTSRRAEESLTDVPLAITALTESFIEDAAVRNLTDIAGQTPGLSFVPIIGEFLPTPQIRGVGQVDLFATEPNVAIFVDGIYQGAREGLNLSQLAIERVEVVKGPQSAMYGRNSFAGAINIISQSPRDTLGGNASLLFGEDGRLELRSTISGPIAEDVLAGRLSVAVSEFDGSYENQSGGPDLGGADLTTVSGGLRFTPTDRFGLHLRGYYSDDEISPPAASIVDANCEPNASGLNQAFCGKLPAVETDALSSHPDAYGQKRESWRWSLSGDYEFDSGWTLNSLTGFNSVSVKAVTDVTRGQGATYLYNTNPAVLPPVTGVFTAQMLRFDPTVDVEEFSQEIRLDSPQDRAVRGSIGLFYYDFERNAPEPDPAVITPLPDDFASFMPPFAGNAIYGGFFDAPDFDINRRSEVTDTAVFGFLEADATERLTLRGELRYSVEEQSLTLDDGSSGTEEFDTWSGRVTADYSPDADSLIYASIGRGVKAGGFDEDDLNAPFGPEENLSYELGYKRTLGGGRGVIDIAAFFIDRTDVQTPILVSAVGLPVTVTTNLGDAQSYGLEAEFTYALTDGLDLRLGGAWTEAEITNGISASYAQYSQFAPDGDISGQPMGRTPEWQFNGSLSYQAQLVDAWDWFARADASYQGEQFTNPAATTIVPARTIVNLRAGLDRDPWRLEVFAENAFDEDAPVSAFNDVYFGTLDTGTFAIFPWRATVTHGRRQLLGARVSVDF